MNSHGDNKDLFKNVQGVPKNTGNKVLQTRLKLDFQD